MEAGSGCVQLWIAFLELGVEVGFNKEDTINSIMAFMLANCPFKSLTKQCAG